METLEGLLRVVLALAKLGHSDVRMLWSGSLRQIVAALLLTPHRYLPACEASETILPGLCVQVLSLLPVLEAEGCDDGLLAQLRAMLPVVLSSRLPTATLHVVHRTLVALTQSQAVGLSVLTLQEARRYGLALLSKLVETPVDSRRLHTIKLLVPLGVTVDDLIAAVGASAVSPLPPRFIDELARQFLTGDSTDLSHTFASIASCLGNTACSEGVQVLVDSFLCELGSASSFLDEERVRFLDVVVSTGRSPSVKDISRLCEIYQRLGDRGHSSFEQLASRLLVGTLSSRAAPVSDVCWALSSVDFFVKGVTADRRRSREPGPEGFQLLRAIEEMVAHRYPMNSSQVPT
jgi:hypothetical protein